MAESVRGSLYEQRYEEARALFDDTERCIEMAKYNLNDPTLPPYYVTENCILIACAFEDWDDAEVWRLSAEQVYTTTFAKATQKKDNESLEVLQQVRKELDQLLQFKLENFSHQDEGDDMDGGGVDNEAMDVDMAGAELLEDVAGSDFEDAEAVALTEKEIEVAANHVRLPLRPAGLPSLHLTAPTDNDSTGTAAGNKSCLERIKRKKGGGAAHNQEFTKSLGKSEMRKRLSILDINWNIGFKPRWQG